VPYKPLPFYSHTLPGVEEIAWLEIRQQLASARFDQKLFAQDQHGIVAFTYDGPFNALFKLRTVEDVFIQLLSEPKLSRGYRDLGQITDWVANGEAVGRAVNSYLRYRQFSRPPTYQLICRKFGKHQYNTGKLARAVAVGLARRYPTWTAVPEAAQVEIWANLLGSHLLLGIRLRDKRRKQTRPQPAIAEGLSPSLAAAMILLTEPQTGELFVDPLCGDFGLLRERRGQLGATAVLLGGEAEAGQLATARQALHRRQRGQPPLLAQWQMDRWPLATAVVDKVATVLPKRVGDGSERALGHFYGQFAAELQRVLRPGGRTVLYTEAYDLLRDSLRPYAGLALTTGYSVTAGKRWGRIYIIVCQPPPASPQ
jgi:tRNA (guanine6-N2)-methyltransferase